MNANTHSMTTVAPIIEKLMLSLIGSVSKEDFKKHVHTNWTRGKFVKTIDKSFYPDLDLLRDLHENNNFTTTPCFQAHQVPAHNTTIYDQEFVVRLVHDSPDNKPLNTKVEDFNIEQHYHSVDSIIGVISKHKKYQGHFLLHSNLPGYDVVVRVPLEYGSFIFFPSWVNHTFKPSDNGLVTLNMTEEMITPQTKGFSFPSTRNFDHLPFLDYAEFTQMLK